MGLHPKTSAAVVGGSLGVVIVSVLSSIHGIHLSPEANAAIPTFLSAIGSWFTPANDAPIVVTPPPAPAPTPQPPAPVVVTPPAPPAPPAPPTA